jgi:predicted MPP superfamily phosphohydrolase
LDGIHLKFLVISDTHLGKETSLLSYPSGRQRLWKTLRETFSSNKRQKVEVDEMILLGDIPDRSLSSTAQIVTHTNAFIQMLGSAANIKKAVYLPGNHDHTLWTNYRKIRDGNDNPSCITEPEGELLIKQGVRCDINRSREISFSSFVGKTICLRFLRITCIISPATISNQRIL